MTYQSVRSSLRPERVVTALASWYRVAMPYLDDIDDYYLELQELEEFIQYPTEVAETVARDFYDPYPIVNEYNSMDGAERVWLALATLAMGANGQFTSANATSYRQYIGRNFEEFILHPYVDLFVKQVNIVREFTLMHVLGTIREYGFIEMGGDTLTADCLGRYNEDSLALRFVYDCELKRIEELDDEEKIDHRYVFRKRAQATY